MRAVKNFVYEQCLARLLRFGVWRIHPVPGDVLLFQLGKSFTQDQVWNFGQQISRILPSGVCAVLLPHDGKVTWTADTLGNLPDSDLQTLGLQRISPLLTSPP